MDGNGPDLVGELAAALLAEGLACMCLDTLPDPVERHIRHSEPPALQVAVLS